MFDHAFERELNSVAGDLDIPMKAIEAIRQACRFLAVSPFSCRKADASPFARELIIPFGATGYVVFFEIMDSGRVHIGAIRHQRESDYH
ncbi:MAG TPA: type II toxin-antitoxin system RelE/ParE family toxin [Ideonella sp.]|uniref:type II toxin-antitoxin system RelE/ParE family toxin n=1 Tax=Ideonella sp. TaxID=1929293 RepID=UPI002C79B18E|nr:type II toxin-antitoxin system RelE/ParE family toxin [Ideonella sp.]HSI47740.1 type II toxin-antitoxin system RelE/ParE family toxin [Ideonella sp.]